MTWKKEQRGEEGWPSRCLRDLDKLMVQISRTTTVWMLTLPETNSELKPLKMDGWKSSFVLGWPIYKHKKWLFHHFHPLKNGMLVSGRVFPLQKRRWDFNYQPQLVLVAGFLVGTINSSKTTVDLLSWMFWKGIFRASQSKQCFESLFWNGWRVGKKRSLNFKSIYIYIYTYTYTYTYTQWVYIY